MLFLTSLRNRIAALWANTPARPGRLRRRGPLPRLETLEDRLAPAASITTAAGFYYPTFSGPGANVPLLAPGGVAEDASGNIYIADSKNHVVRERVAKGGLVVTIAGTGAAGDSGDNGAAINAALEDPTSVAVDKQGDVFIADAGSNTIREVVPSTKANQLPTIVTYAGIAGSSGYAGNGGPAASAVLNDPTGIALDSQGNLYIADAGNNVIREVDATTHIITTVAGNGTAGYSGDFGQAASATLNHPTSVAVDSKNDLYIADANNNVVRIVIGSLQTSNVGVIYTYAGNHTQGYRGDNGIATAAELHAPSAVAVDANNNLFIVDAGNNVVREVNPSNRIITTVVGTGTASFSGDNGQAVNATLDAPMGVAVDSSDDLYIADTGNNVIRGVYGPTLSSSAGLIVSEVGNHMADAAGNNVPAVSAELVNPQGVATDAQGDLFIADTQNNVVREVNASTHVITIIAGSSTGQAGYTGDNSAATSAELNGPTAVAVDAQGNVYIADTGNNVIREVSATTHFISTVAGSTLGTAGFGGDNGPAINATLNDPTGVAVDSQGDLFIADRGNQVIREVNVQTPRIITTVAGTANNSGYSGDGALADSAALDNPTGVAVDGLGNLFIADTGNNVVREVNAQTQNITTIVGNGKQGYTGDTGSPTSAELNNPTGVAVDGQGDLFIADGNNVIREVPVQTNVIITAAGTGLVADTGDGGQPTSAALNGPTSVATDLLGNLYIADAGNNVVREVLDASLPAPVFTFNPNPIALGTTAAGAAGAVVPIAIAGSHLGGAVTITAPAGVELLNMNGMWVSSVTLTPSGGLLSTNLSVRITSSSPAGAINAPLQVVTGATEVNVPITGVVNAAPVYITTFAGNGVAGFSNNTLATSAELHNPSAVAVDAQGDVFIADYSNNVIREVLGPKQPQAGSVVTYAGIGSPGYTGDNGQATSATLNGPLGLAVDSQGDLFIADSNNDVIREVNATGVITTVAGNTKLGGGYSGDNGQAVNAALNGPTGLAVDSQDDLFISDSGNNVVREVNGSTHVITTYAGNHVSGYAGDGRLAASAELSGPGGLAVDAQGDLYIADGGNNVVREVNASTQIITTVAGNNTPGYSGDYGPAASATLRNPQGVALDGQGDLFIADAGNLVVREVNAHTQQITTAAGTYNTSGYSGDNGPATSATLNFPNGVAADSQGNVYIADFNNNVIRKVGPAPAATVVLLVGPASLNLGTTSAGVAGSISTATISGSNLGTNVTISGPAGVELSLDGVTWSSSLTLTTGAGALASTTIDVRLSASASSGTVNGNLTVVSGSTTQTAAINGVVNPAPAFITTIAGDGLPGFSGDNSLAASIPTAAAFNNPTSVAVDSQGNVFIADWQNNVIREVNHVTGVVSTVAGTGTAGYSGDNGLATNAELSLPYDVTVDAQGDLFIADSGNNVIREVNAVTHVITTVAGNGRGGYSGDGGPATKAQLDVPSGLALDSQGDLFIADTGNNVIREVNASTGIITTVAGNGTMGYTGDKGLATAAELNTPYGVTVDAQGDLFIADTDNNVIREVIASTHVITTVAGNGVRGYTGDTMAAVKAELNLPDHVTVDNQGDIFIPDRQNNVIREVNATTNIITTVVGNGVSGNTGDGGGRISAELALPTTVVLDSQGNLLIADQGNSVIREVNAFTQAITTFAGNGKYSYSGDSSALHNPYGVAVDPTSGDVYIADSANNVVRKINAATGVITTFAGSGTAGFSGDNGPATSAQLTNPTGVAVDANGNVFIADEGNNVIREVAAGTSGITTVAGTNKAGFGGDGGAATSALLDNPTGVAVDGAGDLFIADTQNNVIREVDASTGNITTYAGKHLAGYSGDGGNAASAMLHNPTGVALDAQGDLFIADEVNNVIRKVTASTGVITTVAGNANLGAGDSGDGGSAVNAELNLPTGVAVDGQGDLFIADTQNHVIREVNASSQLISTVAGTGVRGNSGDAGLASAAQLAIPNGIAATSLGTLYIADAGNNVVREVASPITGVTLGEPVVVEGDTTTITWGTSNYTGKVDLLLSTDGGISFSTVIATNQPNTGSYTWTVPSSYVASPKSEVRVQASVSGFPLGTSGNFTIYQPTISMVSSGGQVLINGNNATIAWTDSNFSGPVNILLSTNGGQTFTPIASNQPNSGTYAWTVSTTLNTAQAEIRVEAATGMGPQGTSSNFNLVQSGPIAFAEFSGAGVWRYSLAGFQQTVASNASLLTSNATGDAAGLFPGSGLGYGVYRYLNATGVWSFLTQNVPSQLLIDGSANVFAVFPGAGLWEYTTSWQQLTPSMPLQVKLDAAGDVFASFGGAGIYEYQPVSGFQQLTTITPLVFDVNAKGNVAAEFSNAGVWYHDAVTGNWQQLSPSNATMLALADNGDVVGYFPGAGIYRYAPNSGPWQALTLPRSINVLPPISLLIDASGDVTATYTKNGMWQAPSNGGFVQVETNTPSLLTEDLAGDVFAAFTNNGGLYEYLLAGGKHPVTLSTPTLLSVR